MCLCFLFWLMMCFLMSERRFILRRNSRSLGCPTFFCCRIQNSWLEKQECKTTGWCSRPYKKLNKVCKLSEVIDASAEFLINWSIHPFATNIVFWIPNSQISGTDSISNKPSTAESSPSWMDVTPGSDALINPTISFLEFKMILHQSPSGCQSFSSPPWG